MLSKVQKTWLWVFGAMFVVPEALWGNIVKILKLSFLPIFRSPKFFAQNPKLAFAVIIIEAIGIIGVIYLINRSALNLSKIFKYIFNTILVIILLVLLLSLYLSYGVSQIHFL